MRVSVIPALELDPTLMKRWSEIQANDPALRSPFYSCGFTRQVAQSGQPVRVAVIESGGVVSGFFPHQAGRLGHLHPVGGGFNDYHGLIALPNPELTASALLKACDGRYLGFNHLPLTQTVFSPFVRLQSVSPVLELSGGWGAYVQRLCLAQGTQSPGILSTLRASLKRIERDLGPVRFEMREKNPALLHVLMRMKSEQSIRTKSSAGDPFSEGWIRQLLGSALASEEDGIGASLSTLHAGDTLLALHYGLQSGDTLHSWFPVFDPTYAYYQPGLVLLKKIIETSCEAGHTLIDLGRGTAGYKMRFKTSVVHLGEGAVSRPAVVAQTVMTKNLWKAKIKANPWVDQLRSWAKPEGK